MLPYWSPMNSRKSCRSVMSVSICMYIWNGIYSYYEVGTCLLLFLVQTGFILGTPLKVYHFLAPSSEEKGAWFADLHSHIFAQKRLFHKVDALHMCLTLHACITLSCVLSFTRVLKLYTIMLNVLKLYTHA